jgi:hypothetical protein
MRNWTELHGCFAGRDVLVVGNGPSRMGHDDVLLRFDGSVIACNAYWRDAKREADVLVCYEAKQTEAALRGTFNTPILVPQQGLDPVATVFTSEKEDRLIEAAPHRGSGAWEDVIDEQWWPTALALGNLSGLLAYQLAMVGRARAVYLFGVDCCGLRIAGSDQVLLSAIDERTPGYGPARVPARAVGRGDRPAPDGWDQYRSLWRALTRRADAAGIPTYRALDAGALDWLEVKDPCPD